MLNLFTALAENSASAQTASAFSMLIPMILVVVVCYFLIFRPQRKKDKKDAEMRKNLQIRDEVVTAGGIVGIVTQIKDDTVVVETGGDRSKIRVQKWAIAQVNTQHS